jgi:surfactin synthase thioesterase subunit
MIDIKSNYIRFAESVTPGKRKLICIAHAGGGASAYINWQKKFGDILEVLPIQLPGREDRANETLIHSAETIAKNVAKELIPVIKDCEFAIFGHSMGGILAFALASQLEQIGYMPKFTVISGTSIETYKEETKSKYLSDTDFIKRVNDYEAANTEIFDYPEIRDFYLKILRADFDIVEDYIPDGRKLSSKIYALCGDRDPSENIQNMHSWEAYSLGKVVYQEFEGGHFYLEDNLSSLANLISDAFGSKYN